MPVASERKKRKLHHEEKPSIHLSIDLGTTALKVVAYIAKNSTDDPQYDDVLSLVWGNARTKTPPMICVYDDDDELHFGEDAQLLVDYDDEDINFSRQISMIKLALWGRETAAGARAITRIHDMGKTLSGVLADLLKAIVQKACLQFPMMFHQEVDQLPVHLFLCVPFLWDPLAKLRFLEAAKTTDVETVRMTSESHCGAAFMAAARRRNESFQPGDYIINADIGGGTGDFCSFVVKAVEDDNRFKCELVVQGKPTGELCGASLINEEYVRILRSQGQVAKMAKALKRSTDDVEECISRKFERIKANASSLLKRKETKSRLDKLSFGRDYDFQPDLDDVREAFDIIIAKNIRQIKGQLAAIPEGGRTMIEVPSGFGHCEYFLDKLRDAISRDNVSVRGNFESDLAVAKGACFRYVDPVLTQIPQQVKFGITWDEPYKRSVHSDAAGNPELIVTSLSGTGDRAKASKWVQDRFRWFFSKESRLSSNEPHFTPHYQWHAVPVSKVEPLSLKIYCTDHDVPDHAALAAHIGGDSPTVFQWAELGMPINDIKDLNFPIGRAADGEPAWIVYTQMVMRDDGANLDFGWRFLTQEAFDAQRQVIEEDPKIIWFECDRTSLVKKGAVPFTDDNVF